MSPPRKPKNLELERLAYNLWLKYGTKAHAIRELHSRGYPTADIARAMGVIYQHVRNVVNRKLKRNKEQNNGT